MAKTPRQGEPLTLAKKDQPTVEDAPLASEAGAETPVTLTPGEVPVAVPEPNILLEDGRRVQVLPDQQNMYRVYGLDHQAYDHCHDAPGGEWVYRPA